MNSLMIRQTGKIKEEVVIMVEKSGSTGSNAIIRILDLKDLTDTFSSEKVC